MTAVTASPPYTSPQRRSAALVVEGSQNDSAMLNSILQTLDERRQQRKVRTATCSDDDDDGASRSVNVAASVELSTVTNRKWAANNRTGGTATTADKAEWQLEAERRQAARKGVYVDPEKKYQAAAIQRLIDREQQLRPDVFDGAYKAQKTPTNERK